MPIRVSKVADIIIGWVEFVPGLEDVAKSALFELRPDPRPRLNPIFSGAPRKAVLRLFDVTAI
jgi:hypothetical protein